MNVHYREFNLIDTEGKSEKMKLSWIKSNNNLYFYLFLHNYII